MFCCSNVDVFVRDPCLLFVPACVRNYGLHRNSRYSRNSSAVIVGTAVQQWSVILTALGTLQDGRYSTCLGRLSPICLS